MSATDIINNLLFFQQLLNKLLEQESAYQFNTGNAEQLTKSLKIEYSFITLDLDSTAGLHCSVMFEFRNRAVSLKEVYAANKDRTAHINKLISTCKIDQYIWEESPQNPHFYPPVILQYLASADAIAGKAFNCTHGDNYYPGYFSKTKITDNEIVLSQINHMNSKSLDHKTNYSLRELEFIIPLTSIDRSVSLDETKIGDMLVHFSDRSSSNNKNCGELITQQIKTEKEKFENTIY